MRHYRHARGSIQYISNRSIFLIVLAPYRNDANCIVFLLNINFKLNTFIFVDKVHFRILLKMIRANPLRVDLRKAITNANHILAKVDFMIALDLNISGYTLSES